MTGGSSSKNPPAAVLSRIRSMHVDRFLIKRFSEEQIHSLTPAQFRRVVDAAVPYYGEEIVSLDSEAWVQLMISDKRILGPQAPPPSKFVDGEYMFGEIDACTTQWVQRTLCILSGHTAVCCEGQGEGEKKSKKSK